MKILLSYFLSVPAVLERDMIANGNLTSSNSRVAALVGALAPLAIDLVGNLFGGNSTSSPLGIHTIESCHSGPL